MLEIRWEKQDGFRTLKVDLSRNNEASKLRNF